MILLTTRQIHEFCHKISDQIIQSKKVYTGIFPILRGGYYPAVILSQNLSIPLVYTCSEGTLIVDDICDTGTTLKKYQGYDSAVICISNKPKINKPSYFCLEVDEWVEFPWENTEQDFHDVVIRQLEFIGENPNREGLLDTPKRVVKMWQEIFRGYDKNQKPVLALFNNTNDGVVYDQMIIDKGKYYSHCEHHMVPFFGEYVFGYIPHLNGKVIGLSKVARLIDYHSAKLQIQERLVHDIVEDLWNALSQDGPEPLGMGLIMTGTHLCKTMRGVKKEGLMTTIKLKGNFKEIASVKEEFLNWAK